MIFECYSTFRTKKGIDKQRDLLIERSNKTRTSNEILSSHVSSGGNVMSVVMRSDNPVECDRNKEASSSEPIARSSRAESRRFRLERNRMRSNNFWASYNNFILCNRSIELRITKLFSFQNTQYIVAFSKDFFDYSHDHDLHKKILRANGITYQSCYVIQLIKFSFDACVSETPCVEYLIDFRMQIDESGNGKNLPFFILYKPYNEYPRAHRTSIECADYSLYNQSCERDAASKTNRNIFNTIFILILSFGLLSCACLSDWTLLFADK